MGVGYQKFQAGGPDGCLDCGYRNSINFKAPTFVVMLIRIVCMAY